MTSAQALRKAIKLFGKNAAVRDEGKKFASTHEQRALSRKELKTLREQCVTPEQRKANRAELDRLLSLCERYRYCIGSVEMGMFFAVKACGDSWEGCFTAWERNPSATQYERPEEPIAA